MRLHAFINGFSGEIERLKFEELGEITQRVRLKQIQAYKKINKDVQKRRSLTIKKMKQKVICGQNC